MPIPTLPPELKDTVDGFVKDHKQWVASTEGKAVLRQVKAFLRLDPIDARRGLDKNPAAVASAAAATTSWLLQLPPALHGHAAAPLHDFSVLSGNPAQEALSGAVQVLSVGSRALVLGGAQALEGKPDFAAVAGALLQVAFGADAASAALRQGLIDPRAPWPMVPKAQGLSADALRKIIVSGSARELLQTFATCGVAAQENRRWVQQVQPLGHVTALVPPHACPGQALTVEYAGFGAAPAAGWQLSVSLPRVGGGCQHVRVSLPTPWKANGSISITLPADIDSGPVGFFLQPPPMGDGGCEVGALTTAAGMMQSTLADVFGRDTAQRYQRTVDVAGFVEAARFGALPCAATQSNRINLLSAGAPRVVSFDWIDGPIVHPRGSVGLRWRVDNADEVRFVVSPVAGSEHPHELPAIPGRFPATGQLALVVPCSKRWEADVTLQAINANACGAPVESTVRIRSGFSHWRLGVARQDITDRRPGLPMAGFAYVQQKTDGSVQRDEFGQEVSLFARAFYIGENRSGTGSLELLVVVADIWTCTIALKQAVLERLNRRSAAAGGSVTRFDDANVMVTGTHTHAAPGGYSHYALYNLTTGGFDEEVFDLLADGIASAAWWAQRGAAPGTLRVNVGDVSDCGANRSMPAFERNPEHAAGVPPTDREMLLLRFDLDTDNLGGRVPIGVLDWYAIHPTALGMYNRTVSGDCKGWAAWQFERTRLTSPTTFVAAFGNAAAGDVSGNYRRDAWGSPVFERPLGGPPPDGDSFPPRWEVPSGAQRDQARMRELGDSQFRQAQKLFAEIDTGGGSEVIGRLDLQHRFVDFSNVSVAAVGGARTWPAALGVSFGAGSSEDSIAYATLDGFDVDAGMLEGVDQGLNALGAITGVAMAVATVASVPSLIGRLATLIPELVAALTVGTPLPKAPLATLLPVLATLAFAPSRTWVAAQVAALALPGQIPTTPARTGSTRWEIADLFSREAGYAPGHGEKPIMFAVGLARVSYTPNAAATEPVPEGTSAVELAAAPCPLVPHTLPLHLVRIGGVVLAGVPSEFTATAGRRLKAALRTAFGAGANHVAIAGYCNGYSGYVTTREEYGAQHYEGASTLYGEHTLAAYEQEFTSMAAEATGGTQRRAGVPEIVVHVVHRRRPTDEPQP